VILRAGKENINDQICREIVENDDACMLVTLPAAL